MANNGQEGVDIVTKRVHNKEKPFDLIFMDIHMPVMGGLEAASIISALGINTPIVVMTANIMTGDMELYKASGILDCVSKPFTSQELWKCLLKYFCPVSVSAVDNRHQAGEDEKLQKLLKVNFVESNQTTYSEIVKAIDNNDIKTAHRLAHTLKSNAGQIGKKRLQEAAAAAETMLADRKNPVNEELLHNLESELQTVLDELAPLLAKTESENTAEITDAQTVHELIGKLEPLLMYGSPESLHLLDEIRAIPGSSAVATQIEELNFKQALEALSALKKKWE